jgi:Ca2+-binding EF-hand superfamily protein
MKKLLISGAAAALAAQIAPAVAQPAPAPPPGVAQGTAPVFVAPGAPAAPRMHRMVMSDRVMTRAEVTEHVRKLFAKLDANKDGYLTHEEIYSFHEKMIGMHADTEKRLGEHGMMMGDRGAMFDKLDTNHDGVISRQEFLAGGPQSHERRLFVMREGGAAGAPGEPGMRRMMEPMHGAAMHRGDMYGHLFEMADVNHDGRVSLQEAEAAALAHFDKADLNHDGKITPEERQQAHKLMREHRPS